MTDETVTDIAELDLPFHRRASLKDVQFDGGLKMLRLTLREGRRFTIIDMDAASADRMGALMVAWAAQDNAPPAN